MPVLAQAYPLPMLADALALRLFETSHQEGHSKRQPAN